MHTFNVLHCKETISKIRNKYSQKRKWAATVLISTFICIWATFFPEKEYLNGIRCSVWCSSSYNHKKTYPRKFSVGGLVRRKGQNYFFSIFKYHLWKRWSGNLIWITEQEWKIPLRAISRARKDIKCLLYEMFLQPYPPPPPLISYQRSALDLPQGVETMGKSRQGCQSKGRH